ncbi:glutaredoxin [Tulasnella sp. JGI-2019a]|nr:glutaredoxin [Tulasnella sp. JGI-2019a]KAG9013210.1 glutaredoxin [Tulasnella sp. JGI-2019a]KAG9033023.1 glutaredoxin [Tulasnella sp. JGI-2019a]
MTAKDIVESAISDNQIVIFSKSYCPYCKRAKALFSEQYPDKKTQIYELDERDDGSEIQGYLLEKTGQRTVPNIFVNQEHVGGSDDLVAAKQSGKLAKLMAA